LKKEGFNLELDFYGYTHFYPEYVNQCYQAIQEWDLEDHVSIHEFSLSLTQALESADISLCLSTAEGFPGSIKDALAARVLVVATPIGGIPELILDGITGVLCAGTSVDDLADGIRRALAYSPEARQRILEQGRRIARLEAHPQRIVNDLFRMYNLALDIAQGDQRGYQPPVPVRRSESASQTSRARIKSPTEPPASLTPVGRGGVIYAFTPEAPNWSGLELLYSTIDRPVSGNLILKVRSDGGNIVREVTKELSTRSSQSWVEMLFHPIKNSGQRPFQLEITFDTPGGPRLSLFESVPARHKVIRMFLRLARVVGFRTQGRSLYSRVWYSRD
jgi:hypothetical protein